jgi:hypothetical protein
MADRVIFFGEQDESPKLTGWLELPSGFASVM